MKLILAQGNPGKQYDNTRHNVGFFIIDQLAQQWGSQFAHKPKFLADIAETTQNGQKVLLVKPTTFYNDTGQTARALTDFYKLDPSQDLLVIHDELALPFGTIRTRLSGSDAGNNGIKSLNSHIGSNYARIRIGIATEQRSQFGDADFVLAHFTKDEQASLPALARQTLQFVADFVDDNLAATKVTQSQQPPLH